MESHQPPLASQLGTVAELSAPAVRVSCSKTLAWRRVLDTVLVAAASTAAGKASSSQRLTRHMVTLAMPAPSEGVLRSICTAVLGGFLGCTFTPGELDMDLHIPV
jgi:hypothetical protein